MDNFHGQLIRVLNEIAEKCYADTPKVQNMLPHMKTLLSSGEGESIVEDVQVHPAAGTGGIE